MTTYKVKYRHYIVNLYLPEIYSGKVVLLLPGLPMSTNVHGLIQTLVDTGAIVYYPYFSGSFDSGGKFSASSSIKDVSTLHFLTQMKKHIELYFGKEINLGVSTETILIGMSYSAAIALLGNSNLYQRIVLLSPAFLFDPKDIGGNEGETFHEQMKSLLGLLKSAHPYTYRTGLFSDLNDFLLGKKVRKKEITHALNDLSFPTMIVHGTRDSSIPVTITKSLEKEVSNSHISWNYVDAGHSISSYGTEALSLIRDFVTA